MRSLTVSTLAVLLLGGVATAQDKRTPTAVEKVRQALDQKMTLDFRSHMFQHVQGLSMAAHDQRRSGMLIYCINSMCDGVPRLLMAIPPPEIT